MDINLVTLRDLLGFGSRFAIAWVCMSLWIVTRRAAKYDGIVFDRLVWAWFALTLTFGARAFCDLEQATNFLPAVDLMRTWSLWSWTLSLFTAVILWRFWMAMNRAHPKSKGGCR